MTGDEIIEKIKKHKGRVSIRAAFKYQPYIEVVKGDLIRHFSQFGDQETGCSFSVTGDMALVDQPGQ